MPRPPSGYRLVPALRPSVSLSVCTATCTLRHTHTVTPAQAALEALADMWAAFEKLAARAGVAEALRAARERMLRPVRLAAATISTIHAVHQCGNLAAIGVKHAKEALFVVENILCYQVPDAPVPATAEVLTWSRENCDPKNYLFKANGKRSPTGLVELLSFEHVTRGSDKLEQEYPILLDCLAMMKKDVGNKDVGGGVGGAAKSSRYIEPPMAHRMAATEKFIANVRPPRARLQPTGPFTRWPAVRRFCLCYWRAASPVSAFKVATSATSGWRA